MNKLVVVLGLMFVVGVATAQPAGSGSAAAGSAAAGSAAAGSAAGSAAAGSAAAGSAVPPAGSAAPSEIPTPGAVATTPADEMRKTCVQAMNADPEFAKSIIATVDKQIDAKTIAAHEDAARHVAENQRHVVLAYAAMWLIAALFVVFLWRRQQVLKTEIANLRRDLDAAGKS